MDFIGASSLETYDIELNEMTKDLMLVLRMRDSWKSGDKTEYEYRKEVIQFKKKWFGASDREERLDKIIDNKIKELRKELIGLVSSEVYGD